MKEILNDKVSGKQWATPSVFFSVPVLESTSLFHQNITLHISHFKLIIAYWIAINNCTFFSDVAITLAFCSYSIQV